MLVTIGTDCSGIEAPLQALKQLKISYKQLWRCDIDSYALQTAEANYPKPETIYNNICDRKHHLLPHVDIYVCGFPCQPFSMAGSRLGMEDKRTGVIEHMLQTIKYSKPKILILENVRGFMTINNGLELQKLAKQLSVKYNVSYDLYNTKKYGLPQNRERIYIVGVRKDIQKKDFCKPKEKIMKPLSSIINTRIKGDINPYIHMSYKIRDKTIYHIVDTAFRCMDHVMHDITPTVTTDSRPHFIWELRRPFTIQETGILQGFPRNFKFPVSRTQTLKQIGNSMSVNVLKKIIKETLCCI